jgi:competence protein ComEA
MEHERVREMLARAGLADASPRSLRRIAVAGVLVCGLGLWRFWPSAPSPEIAFDGAGAGVVPAASTEPTSAEATEVVVHVAGAVMRPGVYHLPIGSRVTDAVSAAGGLLGAAAPNAINLARIVGDGEQIYLPTVEEAAAGKLAPPGAGGAAGGTSAASTAGTFGLVDLNTATVTELDALPGIGPSTAQKIVDDREANGPFASPEDLMRVPGIGPAKYESLKDLVTAR